MAKKKILFIVTRAIYPPITGDTAIVYNRLKEMQKCNDYDISLIIIHSNKNDINGIKEYKKLCNQVWEFQINFIAKLFSAFKIMIGDKRPFQVIYYDNAKVNKKIKKIIDNNKFDIIHLYLIRLAFLNKILNNQIVILDMIDLMSINFKRRLDKSKSFVKKLFYKIESTRLDNYEKQKFSNIKKIILVAGKENVLKKNTEIIPLGVDTNTFYPIKKISNRNIIFSGNMSYEPNAQAIKWFIEECFSSIILKYSDAKLIIAGANPDNTIKKYENKNIFITGFVKSLPKILNESEVAIAPMQSGSGMQFKVLEAMACGLPVVVTSLGLGSINAINNRDLIVANDPSKFINSILNIFDNNEKYLSMRINSRKFVLENHSWTNHSDRITKIYRAI